jgi:hypothetical protein
MLTSTITLIIIRLFCIQWFLEGLTMMPVAMLQPSHSGRSEFGLTIDISIGMLLLPVVAWFAAPFLASLVAGKADTTVSVPVLSLRDLYAFAFVFLGLYFVLTSVGDALLWLHYSMIAPLPRGALDPERDRSTRSLITLAGGVICIFFGKTWAGKLAESKSAEPQPPAAP